MRSHLYPFVSACLLGLSPTVPARAQRASSMVLSYQSTRANAGPGQCGCFYLQGGSAQLLIPLHQSLSLVAEVSGGTAADAYKGYNLSLLTFTAGPQLAVIHHRAEAFIQALVGEAYGTGLPFGNNATQKADSFALVAGGGLDVSIKPRISLRLFEVDYVHTSLPNTSNDRQNNLRVSAGIRLYLR